MDEPEQVYWWKELIEHSPEILVALGSLLSALSAAVIGIMTFRRAGRIGVDVKDNQMQSAANAVQLVSNRQMMEEMRQKIEPLHKQLVGESSSLPCEGDYLLPPDKPTEEKKE